MKTFVLLATTVVAATSLSACSDGSSDSGTLGQVVSTRATSTSFGCNAPIAGGATQIDLEFPADCPDCSANQLKRAIDNNRNSATAVTMTMSELDSTKIRVTAQDGVVFPAGGKAGATFRFTGGETLSLGVTPVWRIVLRTYLDGVMNLSINEQGSSFRSGPSDNDEGYRVYIYSPTAQPFDAVEIEFSVDAGSLKQSLELYEVCSDF